MFNKQSEINKDFFKDQKNFLRVNLDDLLAKVKTLISKLKEQKYDNIVLKEYIKNLNLKISELKLLHTKLNTELINKDKEISDLKNSVMNSAGNRVSISDKNVAKSRIQELITRIDTHLENYENDESVR